MFLMNQEGGNIVSNKAKNILSGILIYTMIALATIEIIYGINNMIKTIAWLILK